MVTLLNSLMRQRWGVWLAKLKASKSLAALSRAVASVHASEGGIFALGDELMVSLKNASKPGDVAQLKVRLTSRRT